MFWTKVREQLETGEPAFLALVAANSAHSPGTRGAKLMVRPDGSTEGTIGGGILEADVIERAVETLDVHGQTGGGGNDAEGLLEAERLYHRKKGQGKKSGLICAGNQTNVYYVCDPRQDLEVVREVARRLETDRAGLLVIRDDGMALQEEERLSRERPPIRLTDAEAGGQPLSDPQEADAWRYEEQLVNWKRAAVIGGGHCGLAMCRTLAQLGYHVTNFDTRPDVFTFRDNEYADERIAVEDYVECGEHIEYPEITHVIVMTSDQPSDVRGLLGVIEGPYPYIGAMGSAAKLHKIGEDLEAEGVAREAIDSLYAPIGLEMTSNKPAEIAISVAAELLRERPKLFPHARPERPG